LRSLDTGAVDTLLALAGPDAHAPYLVELRHLGGAAARPGAVPSALGRRDAGFCLYSGGAAADDGVDALRAALAHLHEAMAPWGTGGACLNFLAGPDVTEEQVRSAYSETDLDRLAEVKRRVDPGDTFRAVVALMSAEGRRWRPRPAGSSSARGPGTARGA
jgi:hypothetical protein